MDNNKLSLNTDIDDSLNKETKKAKKSKKSNLKNKINNALNEKVNLKYQPEIFEHKRLNIVEMVYIFTICSIIGWLIEEAYVFIVVGKIVNRGVLFAPLCSIYGFGAIILYLLFYNFKPKAINIPYVFVVTGIILGAFELGCGLFFKYVLSIEMWNYDGFFLEIFNYTTVPIMCGWGILGTIYVCLIQPLLNKIIYIIPENISQKLAIAIVCYLLIDFSLSVFNLYGNPEILQKMVNPEISKLIQ